MIEALYAISTGRVPSNSSILPKPADNSEF